MNRQGVLKGSIAVTARPPRHQPTGLRRAAPTDDPRALNFDAVAKNKNDRHRPGHCSDQRPPRAPATRSRTSTDAAWADNGSESADSYNNRIGDGHDGMHCCPVCPMPAPSTPTAPTAAWICMDHEYVVGLRAATSAAVMVVNNVRTVARRGRHKIQRPASASPRSSAAPAAPR